MKLKEVIILIPLVFLLTLVCCDERSDIPENERVDLTQKEIDELKKEIDELKKSDPAAPGNIIFTRDEWKGMKLFMMHCNRCHPGGEKGKGPSLNDKPLPDFLIHFQVRSGRGDMPSFKKDQISTDQLKQIILFVRLMRESTSAN